VQNVGQHYCYICKMLQTFLCPRLGQLLSVKSSKCAVMATCRPMLALHVITLWPWPFDLRANAYRAPAMLYIYLGDTLVVWLRHLICDSTVVCSNPGSTLLDNNLRQVVHTHLPSRSQWSSGGISGLLVRDCCQCIYWGSHRDMQSCTWAAAPSLQCLGW